MKQITVMKSEKDILQEWISERNVYALAKYWFGYELTPTQQNIVRTITFAEHKRIAISAMTRYGKTQCVAVAVGMYIVLNRDKKIGIVAPTQAQAEIIRNYMADLIVSSKVLSELVDLHGSGIDRLRTEASRRRQTFENGCEYAIFSAEGEANRLMGFGVKGLLVLDEACLISRDARIKINRMLGDNPDENVLVELMNPWDVDNQAYDDWINPNFLTFHVPWQLALKEGRTTKAFIDEQYNDLPPLAFTVLYESEFPMQAEDSIFHIAWIKECQSKTIPLWDQVQKLRAGIEQAKNVDKKIAAKLEEELRQYKVIIACDPADQGLDYTVIYWGVNRGSQYQLCGWYYEAVSDNMKIASKIFEIHQKVKSTDWNIDGHGLGVGIISRLKQLRGSFAESVNIKSCLFGGAVTSKNKSIYANLKAENYFRLRNIMKQNDIDIPGEDKQVTRDVSRRLMSELMKMKWERNSSEKIKILDPGEKVDTGGKKDKKSPDFADALVYMIWQDKVSVATEVFGL